MRALWLLPGVPFLLVHGFSLAMDRMEKAPPGAVVEDRRIAEGFGVRVYALRRAEARGSLVLIHGTPGSTFAWMEQFRQPPLGWDVIAYDRPGFGASGGVRDEPALDFQVRVLRQAVLRGDLRRPVLLVGHSYGAPVALRAAGAAVSQPAKPSP